MTRSTGGLLRGSTEAAPREVVVEESKIQAGEDKTVVGVEEMVVEEE